MKGTAQKLVLPTRRGLAAHSQIRYFSLRDYTSERRAARYAGNLRSRSAAAEGDLARWLAACRKFRCSPRRPGARRRRRRLSRAASRIGSLECKLRRRRVHDEPRACNYSCYPPRVAN